MKSKLKSKLNILLIVLCSIFVVGCLTQVYATNTYYKMDKVSFYNLDELKISAKYHPGSKNMGVFIVNDLNQNAKDTWFMIEEFAKLGYHIYVFDLPSQGHTKGSIEFGYKKSEYLAEQYYTGVVAFSQLAKLNEENIHIVANGAGARTALQTATKKFFNPKDLTLISTQTNLLGKIDLDVINFVKEDDVKFVQDLNANNPGEDIHLITSNLDNKSSVAENEALKSRMEKGSVGGEGENDVKLTVVKNVLPINEITNSMVIKETVNYIASRDGYEYTPSAFLMLKSIVPVFLSVLALLIIVLAYKIYGKDYYKEKGSIPFNKEFVISKLVAIIPTFIMVFLLPVFIYFLFSPIISIPYFTLVKFSLICCYGIVIFYLYYKTTFANDIGSQIFYKDPKENIKGGFIITGLILVMLYLLSVSGSNMIYNLFSIKTFWTVVFGILCYFTFYVEEREKEVMVATLPQRVIMSAFNLSAVFIVAIILLIMGQFTLALDFFGLVFDLIFVLAVGKLLKAFDSPTRLNAMIQSLLLCGIMISQTVLFF